MATNIQDARGSLLEPKHKIFLSHSGAQKGFVEELCVQLEAIHRFPFFDKRTDSLPWGESFPDAIFRAAKQCQVAVVVLSDEFFMSKWPMLELVAFMEARKSGANEGLKILPLFFKISLKDLKDATRRERWFSSWEDIARKDGRIKLRDWKDALEQLPRFNGFEYVKQGESLYEEESSLKAYRDKVVDALCKMVQPDVLRGNPNDIQGRLRICQRILAKLEGTSPGVHNRTLVKPVMGRVMGLYGTGGIGKTTFCKVLLDELETRFAGKVCHVEVGSQRTQHELLQVVIRSLTDTDYKRGFELWNIEECQTYLQRELMKKASFLALDNVSPETVREAKVYLEFGFHKNSMVLVTARTLNILTSHLGIDERDCMEMPDLEKEEATRLFLRHAALDDNPDRWKGHDHVIQACLRECHYSKGLDTKGYSKGHHYHPLALLVLGAQLQSEDDLSKWQDILAEEPNMKFNLLGETPHPVFHVFERSYKSLRYIDAELPLLFMDVALFTPERYRSFGIPGNIFTWLSMVHELSENRVRLRLELLQTRGMLEDLGDGSRSIGMHDLFREFAKREAKAINLDTQNCVYVTDKIAELRKRRRNCCQELARIALGELERFDGIQWYYFSNIVVLKLVGCGDVLCNEHLNLSGLTLLKSLEAYGCGSLTQLHGLQDLKDLTYLRLVSVEIYKKTLNQLPVSLEYLHLQGHMDLREPLILDHCTNLLELTLQNCSGSLSKFPDLSKLCSIRKVYFSGGFKARTVRGLSSCLSVLKSLKVVGHEIQPVDCPGLSELVGLEELQLLHTAISDLPDFRKWTNLKQIEILGNKLTMLSGLESLPKLEQIILKGCRNLRTLENLRKLPALQLLHVGGCCNLTSLKVYDCVNLTMCLGLSDLTALEELHLCNVGVQTVPDSKELYLRNVGLPLHWGPEAEPNFARLKILNLHGCSELKEFVEMGALPALQQLDLSGCSNLEQLPDLSKSSKLELLEFSDSSVQQLLRYKDVYTLASMPLLKPVTIVKEDSAEADQKRKQRRLSWEPKFFGMDYKSFYDTNTHFMLKRSYDHSKLEGIYGESMLRRIVQEKNNRDFAEDYAHLQNLTSTSQ
ncbi:hypothetical protein KC19_3G078300 [Ceratodon purpureus]|uniref:TIR domain-containing protein n=1 Tax=Ceratodon purpureus TaxID=3225 RepID=A0A8T0IIH8_CERPU|nr:hypothetical protein KC19_3G078300 [Ceratodon purpureus]